MGTRALIHIKDSSLDSPTLVTIYRQYDGYMSGLGKDILKALNMGDCYIVNGIEQQSDDTLRFNGMGCLAAYLISKLKKEIGNVYIYPTDSIDCGEEYTYTLYVCNGSLNCTVSAYGELIEHGSLHEHFFTKND